MSDPHAASAIQLFGSGGFGAIVGWHVYFINRYRTEGVRLGDLAGLVGVVGGGAVLALFPAGTDLFGAYGIGLCAGFFGYLLVLAAMVARSKYYGVDSFIAGRHSKAGEFTEGAPGVQPTAHPTETHGRSPIGG